MTIYNKSTPPVADPICDKDGRLTTKWAAWFNARQAFDNSLQHRWIRHMVSNFTTVDGETFSRIVPEYNTITYPAGCRIMVLDGTDLVQGVVRSCSYSSGSGAITWVVSMDKGHALTNVIDLYYAILTSSVLD